MKTISMLATAAVFAVVSARAETYQATGPVLEVSDSKIVIQKDKEKWSFDRKPDLKVDGELKVGAKVTIQYTMTATKVEVKDDKATKPAPKTQEKTPAKPAKKAA